MTSITERTNAAIFLPVQEFIQSEEYTDADVFDLIGAMTVTAPAIAQAYAYHARDILAENAEKEISYSDVLAHVYWRTYFSPEHASRYQTDQMVNDPTKLAEFALFLLNPSAAHITNDSTTHTSAHH